MPIWVPGYTVNGASTAGQFGSPFSLALHLVPHQVGDAIRVCRWTFSAEAPSGLIDTPQAMAGINVVVAGTDESAWR
ncbi:LLM class oxidoreductase [Dietzia maris]|uniref:hypothetical protein n=1 Tax=Dietzia maris TaxID=37915 RepID=UPI0030F68CB7